MYSNLITHQISCSIFVCIIINIVQRNQAIYSRISNLMMSCSGSSKLNLFSVYYFKTVIVLWFSYETCRTCVL